MLFKNATLLYDVMLTDVLMTQKTLSDYVR